MRCSWDGRPDSQLKDGAAVMFTTGSDHVYATKAFRMCVRSYEASPLRLVPAAWAQFTDPSPGTLELSAAKSKSWEV